MLVKVSFLQYEVCTSVTSQATHNCHFFNEPYLIQTFLVHLQLALCTQLMESRYRYIYLFTI